MEAVKDRFTVSVVGLPEASACSIYSALDDFASVGRMGESVAFGSPRLRAPFVPQIVSTDGKPFECASRTTVVPHATIDAVDRVDIVFVPALIFDPWEERPPSPRFDPALTAWIASMYSQGAVVASVCTGSFVLAEAGILEGQPATTHWLYGDLMRVAYPGVDVQERRPMAVAGQDDRIITGGTGVYFTDLTLYLIQRFAGPERTHDYAKIVGKFWRGDVHDVFARSLETPNISDGTIRKAQEWLAANLSASNPVKDVSELVNMTERTFGRRFRQATGQTPLAYVHDLRVEHARNLLERYRLPLPEVAERVGYSDVAYFRRLFKRKVGMSPGEYRRRFKLPPAVPRAPFEGLAG